MRTILSVSIKPEQAAFIQNKGLKASNLLQMKIEELRNRGIDKLTYQEIEEALRKTRLMLDKTIKFIDFRGLMQEFNTELETKK